MLGAFHSRESLMNFEDFYFTLQGYIVRTSSKSLLHRIDINALKALFIDK